MPVDVLVLGGGGREHALCWRLSRDAGVNRVFAAPGNAGIARIARTVSLDPASPDAVSRFVEDNDVALTVVGPELPLTRGVSDELAARGRLVCGPTRAAAEIESSKVFAKQFMLRHKVPTAACEICSSPDAARAAVELRRFGYPLVLKADGLAAGKGVIIADDRAAALKAIDAIMVARQFGRAGDRMLVEECLSGPEVSVFVLSDGARAMSFHTAQDHKRALDGDRGPNTGGMGAFAPSPLVDADLAERIDREIIAPTIEGLKAEDRMFRGFLYAGLMLTPKGPQVLEFNARLGDPETQVVLPMLDEDLFPLLLEAASGRLSRSVARFSPGARVGVVLASGGYPDAYETGKPIEGLPEADAEDGVLVFHAGTALRDGQVVTAGGRVLTVVGSGADYRSAIARAYDGVRHIRFEGLHYRKDIGARAGGKVPQRG